MNKHIRKQTSISFLFAIFVVACLAPAVYADSSVGMINDEVINALQDFRFGQPVAAAQPDAPLPQKSNQIALNDYAMINTGVIEALKDFRFGKAGDYFSAEKKGSPLQADSGMKKRGAAIEAEVAEQLEGADFVRGIRIAHDKFVADMREILGKIAEN
jgi:hypothetical protein